MQPRVEIRKVRERYFNYSVHAPSGGQGYACDGLCSVAECLRDAAAALGMNFSHARISYEGLELGNWPVLTLEYDSDRVAAAVDAQLLLHASA